MDSGMQLVPSWKSGLLKKLGGIGGKSQQSRWFELRGNEMVYYTEQPKGTIDLARPVTITEDDDGVTWTIRGEHLAHPYTLTAPDAAARSSWLEQISRSMSGPRRGQTEQRIHTLECEREALIATSEQLGKEVYSKDESLKVLQNLNETAQANLDTLTAKVAEQHTALTAAEKHTALTEAALKDKEGVANALTEESARQKAELQRLQEKLTSAIAETNALTARLAQVASSSESLQSEVAALRESMHSEREKAAAEMRAAAAQAASHMETEQERFYAELKEARAQAAAKDEVISQLKNEVLERSTAITALEGEVRRGEEQVVSLESQLDTEKETHSRALKALEEEVKAEARKARLQQPIAITVQEEAQTGVVYTVTAEDGVEVCGPEGVIVRLPTGGAVEGRVEGSTLHVTAPCVGLISNLASLAQAESWCPLPDADLAEGQPASLPVIKNNTLAGWVEGRVLSLSDKGYTAYINNNNLASVFGLSRHKVFVKKSEIKERAPRWALYDAPDCDRCASTSAYNHGPGFGCHRGRLDSPFTWIADEEDSKPWYQVDTRAKQAVGGIVVGGYSGLFDAYLTQLEVHTSKDNNSWAAHSLHDVDLSEGKVATIRFDEYVIARYVRVVPTAWEGTAPAVRVGVLIDKSESQEVVGGVLADPRVNKWLRKTTTELAMLEMEEKRQELALMHGTLKEERAALEMEKEDFGRTKTKLAEANADLTQNIYSLKEKGTMTVRRTILLQVDDTFELDGAVVTRACSASSLASGMKIVSVQGTPVYTTEDVLSAVASERAVSAAQPLALTVTYEDETPFVQNLKEEITLLREEIKRQHTSISMLEDKAKRPPALPKHSNTHEVVL